VAALDAGITPVVRVPANDPAWIGRVLDGGAVGVVVPHVDSRQDAERAADAVRYPPAGSRSLSGLQPQFGYQAIPAGELMRRADALTLLIGIIETGEAIARIDEIAHALELTDLLDRPTGKLSAGQKTRVSLAKGLINSPDLLLLDEPTASLDPDTADWVRARLERYRRERGATVLLASHNMVEVERLCERVIFMKKGEIVGDDTPRALRARFGRASLEEVFLDVARGGGDGAEGAP